MNQIISCPWQNLPPSTITFCEQNLCAYVREPANAWSCLGFVILGIYLLYQVKKYKIAYLRLMGIASIFIGVFSFAFHASRNYYSEYLDITSMLLMSAFMLSLNLQRHFDLTKRKRNVFFVVLMGVCLVLMVFVKPIGLALFGIQLGSAAFLELRQRNKAKVTGDKIEYREWIRGVLIFFCAFIAWAVDITGVACRPNNHWLQGHAVWHILLTFTILFLFRFYRQFAWLQGDKPLSLQQVVQQ